MTVAQPLPEVDIPTHAVDKLPQPFRLVDEMMCEIVELAMCDIFQRELERDRARALAPSTVLHSNALNEIQDCVTCLTTLPDTSGTLVGSLSGCLYITSASIRSTVRLAEVPLLAVACAHLNDTSWLAAACSATHLHVLQLDRKANSLLDINHVPLVPQITSELPPFILISFCCNHIAVAQPTNVATYCIPTEPTPPLRLDPAAARDSMVLSFQPTSSYTPHLFRRNVHNHEAADALPRAYWQVCPTVGAYRKPPPPHPHAPSPPMSTDPACHRFTKGLIFHWLHFGEFLGHTFARCSSPGSTCDYTIPMPHTISASAMSPSHHRLALGLSNGSIFIICAHTIVTQIISPCIAKGILSLAFAHDNLLHLASGDGAVGVFTPTAEGRTNFGGHKSVHVLGSHPVRVRKIISASRTGTVVELNNGRICVLDIGKAAATSSGVHVQAAVDIPRRLAKTDMITLTLANGGEQLKWRSGERLFVAHCMHAAGKIHMHFAQIEKRLPDVSEDMPGGTTAQKYEDLEPSTADSQNDGGASNVDTTIVLGGEAPPPPAPGKPILCTSLLSYQYGRRL
eukprot:jgi/Ulvmu1/9670/UM055_0008.1